MMIIYSVTNPDCQITKYHIFLKKLLAYMVTQVSLDTKYIAGYCISPH